MEKLVYEGVELITGNVVSGSLLQFEDGTHVIAFKEEDGKAFTTPVHPETVRIIEGDFAHFIWD